MERSDLEVKTLFKIITVGEALALNEAARRTCAFEITSQTNFKEEK